VNPTQALRHEWSSQLPPGGVRTGWQGSLAALRDGRERKRRML